MNNGTKESKLIKAANVDTAIFIASTLVGLGVIIYGQIIHNEAAMWAGTGLLGVAFLGFQLAKKRVNEIDSLRSGGK